MNKIAFQQFFRKLTSLLFLIVFMFPTPLVAMPARAAPVNFDAPYSTATSPMTPDIVTVSLNNNSFENGNLNGWTVSSGHVEVLQSINLSSTPPLPTSPTDGTYMALVCNGPGSIDPTEMNNLDGDLGPNNDNDRSILSQTFTAGAGDMPLVLEFDWNWLTSESPTPGNFDDFFMVTLNSANILNGSAAGAGVSPFPDVTVNSIEYTVNSAGSTNGCSFNDGQSGWKHFSYAITTPGVYTLSILVSDQGNNDHAMDSGLLVDNFLLAQAADLKIRKSASPSPVVIAGEEVLYTVTVDNLGPGLASSVVLTDTLPTNLIFMGATPPCINNSGTLTCSLGDLAAGSTQDFQIKLYLPPDLVSGQPDGTLEITNQARVYSSSPDIIPENNQASVTSEVQDLADLRVTKLVKPDTTVRAGETFTYTIYVENLGPSVAQGGTGRNQGISLRDEMLSNGEYSIVQTILDPNRTDQGPYYMSSPAGGTTIEFDLLQDLEVQDVFNGGRWVIQIVALANEAIDVNNCVSVFGRGDSSTPDSDLSNNTSCSSINVEATADLSLTKSDSLGLEPAIAGGDSFTYTLTVANSGPSTAENVTLADAIPAGLEVLGFSSTRPVTCNTGTQGDPADPLLCNLGQLSSGGSASLNVQVRLSADAGAGTAPSLRNNAWVYSDTFDPNNANDRASLDTGISTVADIHIDKMGPYEHAAGTTETYMLHVGNNGPSTARTVMVADIVPPGLLILRATVLGGQNDNGALQNACVVHDMYSFDPFNQEYNPSNAVTCDLGDLPPGPDGDRDIAVDVFANSNVSNLSQLTNYAYVFSGTIFGSEYTHDSDYSNNYAQYTTTVLTMADLSFTKNGEPAKVNAGEQVKYTLTVTNHGPSLARGVEVFDEFPDGILYETAQNCGELQNPAPNDVICEVGDLPPGATQTIDLYGRVQADADTGENLTNQARVSSDTPDPDLDNNSATASTYVEGLADLRITKFGKPDDVVRAGSPLTYTIVVDNFGPSFAHEVTILDQIVSSGSFQLLDLQSDRTAVCDPPGPYASLGITCVLSDTLEPAGVGNVGRWIVTAVVIANEPGSINNLARVSGADFDPDLSNNEAKVEHEISAVVDLSVTKTAVGEVMINDQLLQWGEPWPWGLEDLWPDLPMGSWVNDGRVLTYTLTITNNGPSTAQNIVVKDYLPEGVAPPDLPPTSTLPIDYVVKRVNVLPPSTGSCLWGVLGDPSTPLECNLDSLPGGEAALIQVVISIPKGVPVGTYYYNRVRVYNDLFDPANGNNFDDLFTVVVPPIWLNFLPVINSFISWP